MENRNIQRSNNRKEVNRQNVNGRTRNSGNNRNINSTTSGRTVQKSTNRPAQNNMQGQRGAQRAAQNNVQPQRASQRTPQNPSRRPSGNYSDEDLRRRREMARRRRIRQEKERRRRERNRRILISLFTILIVFGLSFIFFFGAYRKNVVIEINNGPVKDSDFQRLSFSECKIVSGADQIEYDKLGKYSVTVKAMGITHKATVTIKDLKAPSGTAVDVSGAINNEIDPSRFVSNISDDTSVKITYDKKPNFSKEGTQNVKLKLTDEAGNVTSLSAKLTLYSDTEPPVFEGVKDITAYIGDSISYKTGITVTDNLSENIDINVDNSNVNLNEPGSYKIIYTATDDAGNTATAEATLTLSEKPEGYVEPEVVMALADEVLDQILTDDMNQGEVIYAIWKYVHSNIGYVQSDYKESWTGGAYIGLTKHSGDCYIFFSTAKALLTAAGIENIDVVKQDTSHSRHYWSMVNVGTGWYHFDTTVFKSGAKFFMYTDAKLDEYSASHQQSHNRDKSLYPATPDTDFVIENSDAWSPDMKYSATH